MDGNLNNRPRGNKCLPEMLQLSRFRVKNKNETSNFKSTLFNSAEVFPSKL